MHIPDFINLCNDQETEVKDGCGTSGLASCSTQEFSEYAIRESFAINNCLNVPNSSLDTNQPAEPTNGCWPSSAIPSPLSLCRQFWKAGDYESVPSLGAVYHNSQTCVHVHPKFLHSNATSHKWAFGAIAELLDNAVDEVNNGATFVLIDKTTDPRNGTSALLIQDDGGGMEPGSLRRCMSFGFSDKQSDYIGQYGNGFKTSTMRLGADVIVFSRNMNHRTQSVGILSYTFLRQTGSDDVIVPMVDYKFDPVTGEWRRLVRRDQKKFLSNLSMLLEWSPFSTEAKLLEQFDDIGCHGTKIVVFNLWDNDDGVMELDFESDAEDVMISGACKILPTKSVSKANSQNHVANRLWHSLRVYSSILYLHLPAGFRIVLRGQVVDPHYIVNDLKFREGIKYRPNIGGKFEAEITTIIGFLEGSPHIKVHGFNIYHKNRLILPFLPVVLGSNSKGRGIAGVLEANFIKPTHNKQDFERSTLYQRLETRLRDMTHEYWDFHGHLVGYQTKKFHSVVPVQSTIPAHLVSGVQVMLNNIVPVPSHSPPCSGSCNNIKQMRCYPGSVTADSDAPSASRVSQDATETHSQLLTGYQVVTALSASSCSSPREVTNNTSFENTHPEKRRRCDHTAKMEMLKKQALDNGMLNGYGTNHKAQGVQIMQEMVTMMRENKKLHAECVDSERIWKELLFKEQKLRHEIQGLQEVYKKLLVDLNSMDQTKVEKL